MENERNSSIVIPRFSRIVSKETRVEMDELLANRGRHHTTSSDVAAYPNIHQHSTIIPRSELPENVTDEVEETGIVDREMEEEDEDNALLKNRYTVNNATLQVVHEDLSKGSTVEAIGDYAVRSNVNQLKEWESTRHLYHETAEPPLAENMIGCGCDGQPAAAMRRMLAEDAQRSFPNRKFPKHFFVSFGGFHTVLKSLNASGEYFEELLKDIWSSFRDSLDKIKWILFPSDPRQRETDYSWHLLANYTVACHNLCKHLGRCISALEVNDFMLQRAKEYPICALALLEIRLGATLKLMRNSKKLGRRGCVSTFFSAIRLMMPLFAVTHKSDYMYLCQDLLVWYYCASPAYKKVYEEFMFTQLTVNLKPIFHDTFVELSVKDTRGYAGKVYHQGMELAMEMLAAEIPLSQGRDTVTHGLRNNNTSKPGSDEEMKIATAYYKIYKKYMEMNIWTPNVAPIIQGNQKGVDVVCNDEVLQVPGGGVLHSQILSAITELGRERAEEYFIEYYIKNYGDVKKSDKIVDLSKINLTNERIKKNLQQQLIIYTSTTAKDFEEKNIITKAELLELIMRMCSKEREKAETERVEINESMPKKDAKKECLIAYLVKWRSEVFKRNPKLKDEITNEINADFANRGISTKESRL